MHNVKKSKIVRDEYIHLRKYEKKMQLFYTFIEENNIQESLNQNNSTF